MPPKTKMTRKYRRASTMRKPSKAIKKYVKAAIHRNIENKVKVAYARNNPVVSAQSLVTEPSTINLLPSITEGNEVGERIGNRVMPRSNVFKAYFNLLPHNGTTNNTFPLYVRVWILKYKLQNRNAVTLASGSFENFFDAGTTTVGFQNNMLDMLLPVNKDQWIVYEERKFKLGVGQNAGSYSGGLNALDNSSFSKYISFRCGKHWKKQLDYTDTGADRPTNTNLYMVCTAVPADGTDAIGPTCEFHYTHTFTYEDA